MMQLSVGSVAVCMAIHLKMKRRWSSSGGPDSARSVRSPMRHAALAVLFPAPSLFPMAFCSVQTCAHRLQSIAVIPESFGTLRLGRSRSRIRPLRTSNLALRLVYAYTFCTICTLCEESRGCAETIPLDASSTRHSGKTKGRSCRS